MPEDGEVLPSNFAQLPCGGWCLGDCPGCESGRQADDESEERR